MSALESFPSLAKARGGAFYLHGDDGFRKEEVVRALVAQHLDPATRDFNLDPLRGGEVDPETLASVLATPPMMAEWRVVVLREVEGLAPSKKARDELLAVASNPPPGLALVMSCTVPQGSKAKFYRELARAARSVELKPLTDSDVPGWLVARAHAEHGVELEIDAAQALAAGIGSDLGVLHQELEKLTGFVGERARVTLADVEAAGTRLPRQNRWRWLDLVGERRFDEAFEGLGILFAQGDNGVSLVIALTAHLLRIGVVADQGPAGLEATLPQNQRWLARKSVDQARSWKPADVDHALEGLLRVDRLLKASPHTDRHFLEEWLLGLMVRAAA